MLHQRRILQRNARLISFSSHVLQASATPIDVGISNASGNITKADLAVTSKLQSYNSHQIHSQFRYYATNSRPCLQAYAAVDHSIAYSKALDGLHGKQLSLADTEGIGKDDLPFDPFIEEELEEERLLALAVNGPTEDGIQADGEDGDLDDDDYDEIGDEGDDIGTFENNWRKLYNIDGSLKRNKSEKKILAAGAPAGGLFAVIELAGSQHKVTTDDLLIVNRLKPVSEFKIGSIHTLTGPQVLLLGSSHYTLVGMPSIETAEVDIMVEEITKDTKMVIFARRRRKNSKRKNGFRRDVTMLRILEIRPPQEHAQKMYITRPDPAPLIAHHHGTF
jgi:large subunit ribosomal protein L21